MGKNRVPSSASLAIEAARASLAQITSPVDLTGTWLHFDWEITSPDSWRTVNLSIRVSGVEKPVTVYCVDTLDGTGSINCYIYYESGARRHWGYHCVLQGDNRFQVASFIE